MKHHRQIALKIKLWLQINMPGSDADRQWPGFRRKDNAHWARSNLYCTQILGIIIIFKFQLNHLQHAKNTALNITDLVIVYGAICCFLWHIRNSGASVGALAGKIAKQNLIYFVLLLPCLSHTLIGSPHALKRGGCVLNIDAMQSCELTMRIR